MQGPDREPDSSSPISYGIVVHGGVGSSIRLKSACKAVCKAGFTILERGGHAVDAVVEAVRLLEDDGRFNAGRGSVLRLDGRTMEMDASVMDSEGRLGAVMVLKVARNPILVARAVAETPHVALAGLGADQFARQMAFPESGPPSGKALRRHRAMLRLIKDGKLREKDARWKTSDLRRLWNFPTPIDDVLSTDTVGAVAIDGQGRFAVANSTGGASPMMLGRVGDTAVIGAGFFAGKKAAIAATGIGEDIMRRVLAKSVYDLVHTGQEIEYACERGIAFFPRTIPVGLIAISSRGYAVVANRPMAAFAMVEETSGGTTSPLGASPSCERP
jgi:L-asparaginase / beta-aspartyl-peptidase